MCHLVCHLGMYVCALWYNTPVHWAASETTTDTVRLLFAAAGNHVPAAGPHTGTPQITRLNSGRQVLRHSSCPPLRSVSGCFNQKCSQAICFCF